MILELQHALFTLKVLQVIKCAPIPSSIVFTLRFVVEFFKELGARHYASPHLHMHIPLLGGGFIEICFQMLIFLPNNL
jgi:lipid-A-disaccharide synthase-like uncharacterized protein